MALASSGVASVVLERFRTLLKNNTSFETWAGHTGDATAADEHIVEGEKGFDTPAERIAFRPYAVIGIGPYRAIRNTAIFQGTVTARFEAAVDAAYLNDPEQAFREFNNSFGAIVAGLIADSIGDTGGTKLMIRAGEEAIEGPARCGEDERQTEGDYIEAQVTFAWGPRD